MHKRFVVMSLASLMLIMIGLKTSAQEPPGTATGQKIGTIIKTAIDTALPGVTTLLTAIWGNRGDGDKIKKQELQTSLQNARTQFMADAKQKVQPIGRVATELLTMKAFLEPSVIANENVVRMQTRVSSGETLSDTVWNRQKEDWDVAKAQLNRIADILDSDIDKVRDLYLRDKLKRIRDSNRSTVIRVGNRLEQKDVPALREALNDLSLTLRDISAALGYEIADLQNDIKNLSDWASGPAGPIDFDAPPTGVREFKRLLDQR